MGKETSEVNNSIPVDFIPEEKQAKKETERMRKQQEIPGTEPERIDVLESACDAWRDTITDRQALQEVEKDQKAYMIDVVRECIKDGRLVLNPDIPPGVEQEVYAYFDDEGNRRTICLKQEDVKIKVKVERNKEEE